MKRNNFLISKFLILSGVSIITLSACSQALEDPEIVMEKAKQVLVEIQSGSVEISADMTGNNGSEENITFDGDVEITFDKTNEENKKLDLHVDVSGDIQVTEKAIEGDLDFNFITLNKQYYVMLNEFNSSDESMKSIEPFINMYLGKWLRIAEDFIPENIRELQGQDEAMLLKQEKFKELLLKTELFTVSKEYGVEKLNGESVYHYGIEVNLEGFKDYITKAAVIDGRELTIQEVDEAVAILAYIKGAELYIDTDDYYILKAVFNFFGEGINEEGANVDVAIVINGGDYDEDVTIEIPEGAEDFNPLNLLMGMGGVPVVEAPDAPKNGTIDEDSDLEEEAVGDEVMEDAVE